MEFLEISLQSPQGAAHELRSFYLDRLGLETAEGNEEDVVTVRIGPEVLRFSRAEPGKAPFYHFAFLVPGNRFEAAFEWLTERVDLLPNQETGDKHFDFDNWEALACYCLDPVGNIVELIAHRGVREESTDGAFAGEQLVGFSEVGLVVNDKGEAVAELARDIGLRVWDGDTKDPGGLAFVGERARTLILCRPGRGWLPTGRPAEPHPVGLVIAGPRDGEVELSGTPHRLVGRHGPSDG